MFGDLPSTFAVLVVITPSSVWLKVWEVNHSGPCFLLQCSWQCGTKMDSSKKANPLQLVGEAFKLGLEIFFVYWAVSAGDSSQSVSVTPFSKVLRRREHESRWHGGPAGFPRGRRHPLYDLL